jgi:hypothetical protein
VVARLTDALEFVVASDEVSQQNNIFKPGCWFHACVNVLANLLVTERPNRLLDDCQREHDLERALTQGAIAGSAWIDPPGIRPARWLNRPIDMLLRRLYI